MPEPVITGPSNTGKDPVLTLGTVTAPVVRTGGQVTLTIAAIRLAEVVPNPDLVISSGDRDLIFGVLILVIAFAQNLIEKTVGRRLVGAAR
jgi:hypothetical protein